MAVAAPSDKRYRRAHLKPGRKRSGLRSWHVRTIIGAGIVALGIFGADRAIAALHTLEVLEVRHITFRGNHRLSGGEVLGLLDGLRGQNILSVDLETWRSALLNSPWLAEASLRRTLPATIEVALVERAPLAIARIKSTLYLVDEAGTVIDEYGPNYADLDLPIVDGLSPRPGDELTNVYRAVLVRRLLDALRTRNLAGAISEIDVSDARNAVVLLDGDPTLIRLGNERFVERLQSYFEIAPSLREQVPAIDYVDLRFDERVYVGPSRSNERSRGKPAAVRSRPTQTG